MIRTLSTHDILAIHDVLAADFAAAEDPISPSGVKSRLLLESAVSRQHTGFGERLKYDTPVSNAASLTYGICCNHPFHNGNKRTSLVALLCHLDRNDLTFDAGVAHSELYDLMLRIARHGFAASGRKGDQSDFEVEQLARWIRKRTRRVERGERQVTFRELKSILISHEFALEDLRNNSVDVVRYVEKKIWLGLGRRTDRVRIMRMAYPGDGESVGKNLIRDLRERCGLSEQDGVDSHLFYSKARAPDYFVANYRKTLRRLARV